MLNPALFTQLTPDALVHASVILAVGLLLLFSSLSSIIVFCSNPTLHDVIGCYLMSLALSDLLCAALIVPLSVYSALSPGWRFMGDDSAVCRTTSYLQIVLLSATIYTYARIGVDRYAAFMRPSRYEVEHTSTRCRMWILFSWVTAVFLSCPIIVAKMEVNYYPDLELCVLNWRSTAAYSITLGVLVLLPSVSTIVFTSAAIFSAIQRPEELEDSQRSAVDTDPNFVVTLFVLVSFLLGWAPILVMQFLPAKEWLHAADVSAMRFAFVWLAIGGPAAKLLIFLFTNREFRLSFFAACRCCMRMVPLRRDSHRDDYRLSRDERPAPDAGLASYIVDKICSLPNSTSLRAPFPSLRLPAIGRPNNEMNSIEATNRVIEQHFQRARHQTSQPAAVATTNAIRHYPDAATNARTPMTNSLSGQLYGSFEQHPRPAGGSRTTYR